MPEPGAGQLIVIGGHEDKEGDRRILREFAEACHGGRVALATIASRAPDELVATYQEAFRDLPIGDLVELRVEDRADAFDESRLEALDGATGVFFTGGDQLRITSQIGDTPVEARVRAIWQSGGVIGGTSAGASVMSDPMLVAGTGSRIGDLQLSTGLGLLRDVVIDQHFAERGRIGRLLAAVAYNPRVLGIGIDEDTAIVVEDSAFRVIGAGGVSVVDGESVTQSNVADAGAGAALSVHDLRLHVLADGDRFDLRERRPSTAGRGDPA